MEPSRPSRWGKDSLPSPTLADEEADALSKWHMLKERKRNGGPESPGF